MGRVVVPSYPHHVVQRSNNRQVVFAAGEDSTRYRADLRELKGLFGVEGYAEPVRNFVCKAVIEGYPMMLGVNRLGQRMAN